MRNIMKKMFFVLLAVSMISFGPIDQLKSSAETGEQARTTNVHIVKVKAEEGTHEIPGTGTSPEEAFKDTTIKPIKGAKFKVYTATSAEDLKKIEQAKDDAGALKGLLSGLQSQETGFTGENGDATIALPDGYYWVEESVVPSTYKSGIATSFALTLPAYIGGKVAKDFYVYPKNVLEIPFNPTTPDGNPTLKKEVLEGKSTGKTTSKEVDMGEEETWKITGVVPQSSKDLKKLIFMDRISKYLDVVDGSLKVTAGGKTLYENNSDKGSYFTEASIKKHNAVVDSSISEGQSLMKVEFSDTGIKSLTPGENIEITFKTKVNDKAIMGRNIYNGVKVIYGNDPDNDFSTEIPGNPNEKPKVPEDPTNPKNPKNPDPKTPPTDPDTPANPDKPDTENPYTPFVNTGGKKFVKVDFSSKDKLAGAEFAIIRKGKSGNIEFLSDKYGKNPTVSSPKWIDTGVNFDKTQNTEAVKKAINDKSSEGTPKVLTSAETSGEFEIKGIAYGEYKLVELKAPKEYAIPENLFAFKIDKASYYTNANLSGDVNQDSNIVKPSDENGGQIKNTKYTIPQTGGMGTIILTAIGLVLIASAYIVYKKNNFIEE